MLAIDRAVQDATIVVAEKAAAKGLDIIEYNQQRCDQLDKGAVARGKMNGEVDRAKRSDRAISEAKAQMVGLARKETQEARERETRNSRGDANIEEALRRSSSRQEPLGNSTLMYDGVSVNGGESKNVKFYLLDRDTERVKMERWCKLKPTSQYHTMNREGQKRHVEKHINQLIARQKKRSRTGYYPLHSQTQPGMVSAPSPLEGTTLTTLQEPAATLADTGFATMNDVRNQSKIDGLW